MIDKFEKALMVLLFTAALFGCGGGSGSPPAPTPTFNLGKYTSLTTGTSYTITFTGTDTTGASYTGQEQSNVVGSTTFEGKNVIQRSKILGLTKIGFGSIAAGTVNEYYYADGTLYKEVYENGVVNSPTNIFVLPVTVQPSNFTGQSISSSDGSSSTDTWKVIDAGNGTANIVITSTTSQSLSEADTLTVSTTGTLLSLKQVLYDFPSNGVTTTLSGIMN